MIKILYHGLALVAFFTKADSISLSNSIESATRNLDKEILNTKVFDSRTREVLKCHNQSICIQPKLILHKSYKVYFAKHVEYDTGIRFYHMIKEGLLLHDKISFIDDIKLSDIIVYLPNSMAWHEFEFSHPFYSNKTIIFEETDHSDAFFYPPEIVDKNQWAAYMKRSYAVPRTNGIFNGYLDYIYEEANVFPMSYTIMESYVKTDYKKYKSRRYEIVCTLRAQHKYVVYDPARARVLGFVKEYIDSRNIKDFIAGEIDDFSRNDISSDYFKDMYDSKIIVTANPSGWEGDFRLMEAFATGALIFVDQMYVPRPHPVIHGVHVVYYDNNNRTDIFEKLDYYRRNPDIARKVAVAGYIHTMTYHRTANLIDYAFSTLHLKEARKSNDPNLKEIESKYEVTGFDMQREARIKDKELKLQKKIVNKFELYDSTHDELRPR